MASRFLRLIVVAALITGCSGEPGPPVGEHSVSPTPAPVASSTPEAEATPGNEGVKLGKTVIRAKKGQSWEMEAAKVNWDDTRRHAHAKEVDWDLFDDAGRPVVNVTAAGALAEMESERVTFEGTVVAKRQSEGDVLTVNHLIWEGKEKKFYGSQGVRWTRGDSTIAGDDIVTDSELSKVELSGNINARTLIKGSLDED